MWRLIFALLLFILSLLVLFRAPTNLSWKIAVAVTEFPHIFVCISLTFFILCFWTQHYKISVLIISGISVMLYLKPVTTAYSRAKGVHTALDKIFPSASLVDPLQQPYSFFKMFTGIGIKNVVPQVFTYKKSVEKDLELDFYPSSSHQKAPCIIVIHGGSWAGGDSKQLRDLNSYLANRGYHVAAINYRLAPRYKSPAPVEDTRDVITYLTKNSRELNIDTSGFVLIGRSAGAQIALVAAYSFNDPKIRGVVSLYGPADMAWGARIKSNKLVLDVDRVFTDYLGGLIDEVPAKYEEATSTAYINSESPPTLIVHGDIDPMVAFGHSIRLDKKLGVYGVKHFFLGLPGATHGCDYNINGPTGQVTTFAIERFINSVTSK